MSWIVLGFIGAAIGLNAAGHKRAANVAFTISVGACFAFGILDLFAS